MVKAAPAQPAERDRRPQPDRRPVLDWWPVLDWYGRAARDLPWRRPGTTPWGVLVSEVMLQQTPVSRVLPAYERWLARWPAPIDLAAVSPGEAVRAWDRLGYPRRALALHGAAATIVARHGGEVPADYADLRALPGVGDYTAAAVAAFAFGRRHPVLDTNVRRVLARVVAGTAGPPASIITAERATADAMLPASGQLAARVSCGLMELGALVCRSRAPDCLRCPLAESCAWRLAGAPVEQSGRRTQRYEGTDRQARGRLLAQLRQSRGPLPRASLDAAWPAAAQRARALAGLVADGLVEALPGDRFRLPR
jgi:A/G-specific adenine glycosylase